MRLERVWDLRYPSRENCIILLINSEIKRVVRLQSHIRA